MKRLVFCFDGSWNRIDARNPTNVLFTAQSVLPMAEDGTAQLVYYDEGVGTDKGEKFSGGMFGVGLEKNLNDAYRFLIFNHTPGDEIFIFGFSRGAFTARSFAGLIANCGVLSRSKIGSVNEMIANYRRRPNPVTDTYKLEMMRYRATHCPDVCTSQAEDDWRVANVKDYRTGQGKLLSIRYIGVWDTVGALGIPEYIVGAAAANREYQFHNLDLSEFIQSARHAVAIDERKKDFRATLWKNLPVLNAARNFAPGAPDAPYQQIWFPGNHGSSGGGGDVRGLSDQALDWIWEGARAAGLRFDLSPNSMLYTLKPDDRAPLVNTTVKEPWYSPINFVVGRLPVADRDPGPEQLYQVSVSARRRWHRAANDLPENNLYRPATLNLIAGMLDRLQPADLGIGIEPPAKVLAMHEVARDETLSALATRYYRKSQLWTAIYNANRDVLLSPDRIFVGQLLRIPAVKTPAVDA